LRLEDRRRAVVNSNTASYEDTAQEDHDRHDRHCHEQEHELLPVELYLVETVVCGGTCHRVEGST
jgi:hypothetical protein